MQFLMWFLWSHMNRRKKQEVGEQPIAELGKRTSSSGTIKQFEIILKQKEQEKQWQRKRKAARRVVVRAGKSVREQARPPQQGCARQGQIGCDGGWPGRRGHHDDRRSRSRSARTGQANRLAHADGHHPPGQAHGQQFAADQGFCSAGRSERHRLHRLGHL